MFVGIVRWSLIAVHLTGSIGIEAVEVWGIVGVSSAAPAEAPELLVGRTDISSLLAIEGQGRSRERTIRTPTLVEHRYMRPDLTLVYERSKHLGRAMTGVSPC